MLTMLTKQLCVYTSHWIFDPTLEFWYLHVLQMQPTKVRRRTTHTLTITQNKKVCVEAMDVDRRLHCKVHMAIYGTGTKLYEMIAMVSKFIFFLQFGLRTNFRLPTSPLLNPFKPRALFVGHRQTVQNQIRRGNTRRLIRFSTVCLQNVLLKFE